jgi:prevent-host-death family protein
MKTIGIRELKENLAVYLKKVKDGDKIIVTDRKKEFAVIMPMGKKEKEEKLYDMIRNGKATWSGGKPMGIPNRIVSKGKSVSSAVIEDRR